MGIGMRRIIAIEENAERIAAEGDADRGAAVFAVRPAVPARKELEGFGEALIASERGVRQRLIDQGTEV